MRSRVSVVLASCVRKTCVADVVCIFASNTHFRPGTTPCSKLKSRLWAPNEEQ